MKSPPSVKLPFEKQAEADREKYNSDIQHPPSVEETTSKSNVGASNLATSIKNDEGNFGFGIEPALGMTKRQKNESVENLQRLLGLETPIPMDFSFPLVPDSEPLEFA